MSARLLQREVLPFLLSLATLAIVALLFDGVLHILDKVWIGRYLGIPGTLLIIGSFGYSLRKRKLIQSGQPVKLLRLHERMAWGGSLLVLVHAGIHFNSILGWLEQARQRMQQRGLTPAELEDRLYWDSLTFDAVKRWRAVHFPITLAFAVLALAHIVAIFLFWGWK